MSSTKRVVSKLVDFGKSLTYIKNNSGFKFDPCGLPHFVVSIFHKVLLMQMY